MTRKEKERLTKLAIETLTQLSRTCSRAQELLHRNKPKDALKAMALLRDHLPEDFGPDSYIPKALAGDPEIVEVWNQCVARTRRCSTAKSRLGILLARYRTHTKLPVSDALDIATAVARINPVAAARFFEHAAVLEGMEKLARK